MAGVSCTEEEAEMTVKDLIQMLLDAGMDERVYIWDPDSEQWTTVTGMTYGGEDNVVRLYCDEP